MKKITSIVAILIISGSVLFAEEPDGTAKGAENNLNSLYTSVAIDHFGIYGTPVVKVANFAPGFNGPFGVIVGGETGMILDRSLVLGVAVYGLPPLLDRSHFDGGVSGNNAFFMYAGPVVKYHFFPKSVVNFSLGALVGGGAFGNGVTHRSTHMYPVFVAEPEITLYVNLTKWWRFGAGFSYRFAVDDGAPKYGMTSNQMWGYSINVMFQYGRL